MLIGMTVLQHKTNPLHVYCRLRDLGIPKSWAKALAKVYGRLIARHLYKGGI